MSSLEQEILDKFHQLDKDAQQRIRLLIDQEMEPELKAAHRPPFDYAAWVRDIEAVREEIRVSNGGEFPVIDGVGMLRAIRDGDDN
jgi:hypothetical protein